MPLVSRPAAYKAPKIWPLSSGSTCLLVQPLSCGSPWRTVSVEKSKRKGKVTTFTVPGCLWLRVCNPSAPPFQDEQWAVKTANINHMWCTTCGIFIPGGSQTVTHACNIIHMTKVNGGWYGQLRLAMVSAALEPPALQHQPNSLMLTQVPADKNDKDYI